jgi:hypothetical protein
MGSGPGSVAAMLASGSSTTAGFGAASDVYPEGRKHIHHPAGIVGGDYWPHMPIQMNNERHVLVRPMAVETEPVDQIAAPMDPPLPQRAQGHPAHLADGGIRYALGTGWEVVVADHEFAIGAGHRAILIARHAHQRSDDHTRARAAINRTQFGNAVRLQGPRDARFGQVPEAM